MRDNELIDRIKSGDRDAFKNVVLNYQKKVINTCNGFLHNIQDAEDVAQEVFTEMYLSANKFRGDSAISTWLYRIAVNKSLNYIRDNKKTRNLKSIDSFYTGEDSKSLEIAVEDSEQSDYIIENSDRKRNLFNAINSLPENQKTAFILNKYEDLSYKEIADVMKISLSSVESLLFRGKKNLQSKLIECYKKLNS